MKVKFGPARHLYRRKMSVRLPHDLILLMNATQHKRGVTRARLLEEIVREYFEKRGMKPMITIPE